MEPNSFQQFSWWYLGLSLQPDTQRKVVCALLRLSADAWYRFLHSVQHVTPRYSYKALERAIMSRHERISAILPIGTPPLLCSRVQASALLNVAPSTFDKLRKAHKLLNPVRIGARTLWPYRNLVAFVEDLIDADVGDDPWAGATA